MTHPADHINPQLDLILDRVIDIPPELVWAAWTQARHIVHWFTPAPWRTTAAEVDLRPGGRFATTMCSPEGEEHAQEGCFLEVVENRRLVWTDALRADYRPNATPFITAILRFEPHEAGTRFIALVRHHDEASRQRHEEMGFAQGWSTALDQLVAYMKQAKD